MSNFKILVRKGEDSDATNGYIRVIKEAIAQAYGIKDIPFVHSAKEIKKEDVLLIISLQALLFNLLFFKPKQKFIFWFQGVAPEEVTFLYAGFYAKIKSFLFEKAEKYVLKKATFIFFVSEKLLHHHQKKYGYTKDNYYIMPCFNKSMDESCFAASKYEKPTFVFAGSMFKWQCVEEILLSFSKIKENLPEAKLAILTADQEEARKLTAKLAVTAELKYVPLEDLSREMANYKYGFLLRDKNIINEVATPTKMNSYMAAGVIPVFTDAIGDFRDVFRTLEYVVACDTNEPDHIAGRILEMEKNTIAPDRIINEYRSVFDTYYNRGMYVGEISKRLKSI